MEKKIIAEKLAAIFRDVFQDQTILLNDEMTAKDVASWDSLSHMLMIERVENAFSIRFKLKEIAKLKNVGVLIELIESKTG